MGTFIEENLIPGEKIVYKAEIHWMIYFPSFFNLALGLFIFYFGKYALNIQNGSLPYFAMVPVIVAVWKAIQSYIHRHYTEIAITDTRLIAKFGFIRREMIELPLSKIESVIVEQSIFERIIGSGSVGARGTGMAMAPVRYIDEPVKFRNFLNEAISRAKQTS